MDGERRRAAAAALVELAGSGDYLDRADAGRALANFAEVREARESLLRLVFDVDDTFVTRETAEALLRRLDAAGFAIVAEACASADDQQHTYIHDAVTALFAVFASERDRALQVCDALSLSASESVRHGAVQLRELLAQLEPVFVPQEPT